MSLLTVPQPARKASRDGPFIAFPCHLSGDYNSVLMNLGSSHNISIYRARGQRDGATGVQGDWGTGVQGDGTVMKAPCWDEGGDVMSSRSHRTVHPL